MFMISIELMRQLMELEGSMWIPESQDVMYAYTDGTFLIIPADCRDKTAAELNQIPMDALEIEMIRKASS